MPEVAAALGISQSTAETDRTYTKAGLKRAVGGILKFRLVLLAAGARVGRSCPRTSQVFTNALKHSSPAERAVYLGAACAGNAALRAAVEALLRAHAADPDFLEQPAAPIGGPRT